MRPGETRGQGERRINEGTAPCIMAGRQKKAGSGCPSPVPYHPWPYLQPGLLCPVLPCSKSLLDGRNAREAIREAVAGLQEIYRDMPEYEQELEWSIRPRASWEGNGTGYVVDCLRSAFMILERTSGYEETVKQAVLLGNDTDTTACVTGGLAGILYGLPGIPKSWLSGLCEREKVANLLERLLLEKCR